MSETPAPDTTSASVFKAEEEAKQPVIQSEDQASSQPETPTRNWGDIMEEGDEMREQLRLRDAEVLQLKREKEALLALLLQAKNFQRQPDKEIEDLKMQICYLVKKNKTLKQENNKLQKDKHALEVKVDLIERGNAPLRQAVSSLRDEITTVQREKVQLEQDCNRRMKDLVSQESARYEEMVKKVKFAEEQIAVRDQELFRVTGINDSLAASLFRAEEQLMEAQNEMEDKEQIWQTELENSEQLRRDVALKDEENRELLRQKETSDDLQERIRQLEETNQELQDILVQKKSKKTLFKFFWRTRSKKNKKPAEEVIEETDQPQQPEKTTKNKKKSFWSWWKGSRKVQEAAGGSP